MLLKNLRVLFYLKKPKQHTSGLLPIYMRIIVDGIRIELSTLRKCEASSWHPDSERMIGKKEDIKDINNHLNTLQSQVYEAQRWLIDHDRDVTAEGIKAVLTGEVEKPVMIMEVFAQHNEQMEALIGTEFAPATLIRYKTSLTHTRSFIKWKFQKEDVDIRKLNYEFISDYEFWFKSVQKCGHNSTMKYLGNFRKVTNKCVRMGWIKKDPFTGYKMTKRDVERIALTDAELEIIKKKVFQTMRMKQVRDIFLFSCYTGLAYIDIYKLKRSEIAEGIDGGKWLFINRQKTETSSRIPILPEALCILEEYSDHPQCVSKDKVLPILSNQKMNTYLKEMADVCDINKNLTFHIARHTFATTITLSNGVPIETVSKMLGHKNLKTTQHYAKIVDKKISEDMLALRERLRRREKIN